LSGRTPAEAVDAFLEQLRRTLACVTTAPLLSLGAPRGAAPGVAFLAPRERPARLQGPQRLLLRVRHDFSTAPDPNDPTRWAVATVGYAYSILHPDQRELLAYHWHVAGNSPIAFPHLHVGARAGATDLSNLHLPTGSIPLAAIVRLAIAELGVDPLRQDWPSILNTALGNAAPD